MMSALLRKELISITSGIVRSSQTQTPKRLLQQTNQVTTTLQRLPTVAHYHTSGVRCQLPERHGTTIICVRKNNQICMMGDSMVSQGNMIVKPNAIKIRRIEPKGVSKLGTTARTTSSSSPASTLYDDDDDDIDTTPSVTLVGFAGSTADAFTLMERLENKLEEYPGQLTRSCVELAKGWRTDKYLRRLEASLIVANNTNSFELTGNGDVLESHDGILGVGSGSVFAIAAARALIDIPELSAEDVARKAMHVASEMCVYTNNIYTIEKLDMKIKAPKPTTTTTDGSDDSEKKD